MSTESRMTLSHLYELAVILASLVTSMSITIGGIAMLLNRFKNIVETIAKERDKQLIETFNKLLLDYHYPLDDRLRNLNQRVKKLEEK